jgi:hypothetical protein
LAIIAEGVTDQAVLENILLGYFGDDEGELVVNHVQPPREAPSKGRVPAPAADDKLRRLNRPLLSTAGHKSLASYEAASRDYAKHRKLMACRSENPSLDVFVKNLEALRAEG